MPVEHDGRDVTAEFKLAEGESAVVCAGRGWRAAPCRVNVPARRRRNWATPPSRSGGAGSRQSRVPGPVAGDGAPLSADAEAADLRADRRDRGRADDQPARADRRRAQLGLPLRVGPRRGLLRLRAAAARVSPARPMRSCSFMVSNRHRARTWRVRPAACHVRHRRAHRAARAGAEPPDGYRGSAPVRIGNAAANAASARHLRRADGLGLPLRRLAPAHLQRPMGRRSRLAGRYGSASTGTSPTRASGRPAAAAGSSCTPSSCAGWRSNGRSGWPTAAACRPIWHAGGRRDAIYRRIMDRGWSPNGCKAFVQYEGAEVLDAAVLLMPLVKFIAPTDPSGCRPSTRSTASLVSDSLVYRYDPRLARTGSRRGRHLLGVLVLVRRGARPRRPPGGGAAGVREDAHLRQPPRACTAEQISLTGEQQGNFPQAFTHLALISAAFNLDRALDGQTAAADGPG